MLSQTEVQCAVLSPLFQKDVYHSITLTRECEYKSDFRQQYMMEERRRWVKKFEIPMHEQMAPGCPKKIIAASTNSTLINDDWLTEG